MQDQGLLMHDLIAMHILSIALRAGRVVGIFGGRSDLGIID